jgi:transcriptional antiterminator RfaH
MSKFADGWYLMYTKPNHEKKVVKQLEQKKLTTFLPLLKIPCQSNMGVIIKEIPLFPSYIFIKLGRVADFYTSTSVEGFLKYVHFGKEIPTIDDNIIQELRIVVDKGRNIEIFHEIPKIGTNAIIKKGPLSGLFCKVLRRNNAGKVFVHIKLLNAVVSAVLSNGDFS